jgi:hypothetical protein
MTCFLNSSLVTAIRCDQKTPAKRSKKLPDLDTPLDLVVTLRVRSELQLYIPSKQLKPPCLQICC